MLTLKDENLYYIGGVVRDEILGLESFDTDLTYQGNAIEKFGDLPECIKINEPFGTVRLSIDNKELDIASTRDEFYEKKGHLPTVINIGCNLEQDVKRRDFTINSLAKSTLTGEIIDYTGGLIDIKNKVLRVLHDKSFEDDPTRIIRGLKFAVRFGFNLDKKTKFLQEKYLQNINYDMSYKRVKKELIETFNLNSQKAFDEFFNQKIYKLLTTNEIIPPKYNIEKLVNNFHVDNIWMVYLGWMNLDKLPLTREEQKIIDDYNILKNTTIKNDDFMIYKTFFDKTKESILLYIITTNTDYGLRFFEIKDIKISITGDDLKNLGINPSKKYSDCFDFVLKQKLENPKISKSDELKFAKDFFNLKD